MSNELPEPLVATEQLESIDDLDVIGAGSDAEPVNVFIGQNMGSRTFTTVLSFKKFFELSLVANDPELGPLAQRPLDNNHARKLAKYALQGLINAAKAIEIKKGNDPLPAFNEILEQLGQQPYYGSQPIVCNLRGCGFGGSKIRAQRNATASGETASFKIWLSSQDVLWVIDGQHRRRAMEMVFEFLTMVANMGTRSATDRIYPKGSVTLIDAWKGQEIDNEHAIVLAAALNAARSFATVTVDIHLGLEPDQERQLFHDMNNLGKKVNVSLALDFDSANPVNQYISEFLKGDLGLVVGDREIKDWDTDDGSFTRKEMIAVNARVFANKGNAKDITPSDFQLKEPVVSKMWRKIASLPHFSEVGAKRLTVLHQPVVLKAIGKIVFDLKFNKRKPVNGDLLFDHLIEKLGEVDFSHTNPMWRYYEMNEEERDKLGLAGLSKYLPIDDDSVNRDVGSYQGSLMRFGAKHNDIFPLLADMIRWKVGLPSRFESSE